MTDWLTRASDQRASQWLSRTVAHCAQRSAALSGPRHGTRNEVERSIVTKEQTPLDSEIEDARNAVHEAKNRYDAATKTLEGLLELREGLSTVHPRDPK
jgi:hypothetical protein